MSIPGRNSTAAMLVRACFLVVLALANVSGFRPVLARGWHDQLGRSVLALPARRAGVYVLVVKVSLPVADRDYPLIVLASGPYVARLARWMSVLASTLSAGLALRSLRAPGLHEVVSASGYRGPNLVADGAMQ